ncbi:ABC transporter substrate-binding protein [Jongsikchunia kroppenstedtii]|uniref:ABC transporter substrate-binding protein n=1 Tax=Jongsikchunia kroppenstedtii TaxID=1121721 RepID=UPI0003A5D0AC|nr:ABC transporter substrate-binding protein [Jongsikchunia kroppenstedtii]
MSVAMAVGLVVAGCGGSSTPTAASSSSTSPTGVTTARPLPGRVGQTHTLIVGTNTPYAPNEFLDPRGGLVGFDVDVVNAIAKDLGLRVDYRQAPFADLLPSVADGRFDIVMRSLFDTKAREQQVDMVTYYSAGTMWAQRAGAHVDPDNACGNRVAAETGTVQAVTELPAKSEACRIAGQAPIVVVPIDIETDAEAALQRGEVDAVSADSPVILYAVKQSAGRLAVAGRAFDTEPYGFPVAKGSPLGPFLRESIQRLIDSGELKRIAEKWGVQDGLITTSTVNGATS